MFPGAVPASPARRVLAAVLDAVAALVLGGVFVAMGAPAALRGDPSPLLVAGAVASTALAVAQWVLLGTQGATLGKRLTRLRVVDASTARPIGLARAAVRLLVPAAASLVVVGPLLVALSVLWDPRRQGWHDRAARSVVLDVALGGDPRTAGAVSSADVSRRIDGLLAGVPAPPVRELVGAAAGPGVAPPPPAPPPVPVPSPAPPPAPAPAPALMPPPAPARAPVQRHRAPDPDPEPPVPAPTSPPIAAPPTAASPAGLISSVPGVGVEPPVLAAASPVLTTAVPASPPPAHEDTDPAADRTVGEVPAQRAAAPLEDDLEHTRLSHASRRAVPEVENAGRRATLRLWDGRTVELRGTLLLGRDPAPREGEPEPDQRLAVADPGRSVSKTHLALGVDADGVWLRDRNSTNGTVVTLHDGQQILCAAGQTVRVPRGASVAFGDFWLTVSA